MTAILDRTRRNSAWMAILVLLTAPMPAAAQEFDPTLGADALSVMENGRVALQNGDDVFDCALIAGPEAVTIGDCRPGGGELALLSMLSDEDWQAVVRDMLLDEECRLSAFGAVAEVVAAAAEANGVDPGAIESARAALNARADAAVAQMVRDGRLTYRGGELALDACP